MVCWWFVVLLLRTGFFPEKSMSSNTVQLWIFLGIATLARAAIPDDYILKVSTKCGKDAEEDATIDIITDLNAHAVAICDGGITAPFTTSDDVNFQLKVSYPNQGSLPCVFKKRRNSLVFAVKIAVAYGEDGSFVHEDEEEYTVTCTFSPRGEDDSVDHDLIEGLIAPPEIPKHKGPLSTSDFNVELVDIRGRSFFKGRHVSLGRMVQLRGQTTAKNGEKGIRPVSCYAMDGNSSYAILRAGCGDGIVFDKKAGFITRGNQTFSPYFAAFSINITPVIKFRCNFVTCDEKCPGSSCDPEVSSPGKG